MSYIVNWASSSDLGGKPSISVADKTADTTSTSITLTGKGLNNYGLIQQENYIKLLENFARSTPPLYPTTGQQWYNSVEEVLYLYTSNGPFYNGWAQSSPTPIVVGGLADYGFTPDPSFIGMSTRLNRIIGAPSYVNDSPNDAYGWGQTDLVPTYDTNGKLDAASTIAQAFLPASNTFPPVFTNASWAILVSRLRRALRHVGLDEGLASPVGFISDGRPGSVGDSLANYYNNFDTGSTPYQGTIANIAGGWGHLGIPAVSTYLQSTKLALDALEAQRFELAPAYTQLNSLATAARSTPGQTLGVPSSQGTYVHDVVLTFANKAEAQAFFNAGGKLQFNWSFAPSGSPSNVETAWQNFLAAFTSLSFDYFGTKLGSFYEPYIPGSGVSRGFYHVLDSVSDIRVFERSVLDTPGGGFYASDPPTDGGIIVSMSTVSGADYALTIKIEYYLQDITATPPDVSLDGTLTSNITAFYSNSLNTNVPAIALPSVAQGGTFITSP